MNTAAATTAVPRSEMKVVIKRKRDEPVLPSFVLANKRPALSRLSIGDGAPDPPMIRYTLVGLTPGSTNVPEASGKEQQQAHEPDARPNPSNSRFRTVAMHSTADGQVLELQRCEPKLVPFGPPLPPRSRPVPQARSCTNADTAVDDIWRDAAAASGSLEGNLSPQPMADEYVYDEYTVAADADDDGDASLQVRAWNDPEIWWEELDADEVRELEALEADGSDSQEEEDYPEDEPSDDGSYDDDY